MANVYKKSYTQPLPKHCEIIEQDGKPVAKWIDRRGHTRYEPVTIGRNGQYKLLRHSPTWYARYNDADGIERIKSTGCKDEQSARHVLAELLKRVEHVKSGIFTPEQHRQSIYADQTIQDHITAYLQHLKIKTVRGKSISKQHQRNRKQQLERITSACHFKRLQDINREAMERWMGNQDSAHIGSSTINHYRAAIVAFCNWCVDTGRLSVNPLNRLHKADEYNDKRRIRRALTEDEIYRLLRTAEIRPIAEFGRESVIKDKTKPKSRSNWTKAELTWENLEEAYERGMEHLCDGRRRQAKKLAFLGKERSLIYRTLIYTGLRKSELASITLGQVYLDERTPHLELLAKDEKAGRGAMIPLRADLAQHLRSYIQMLHKKHRTLHLPHNTPLFKITQDMIRVFGRDLTAASIPKYDERGRVVDIHALRHTFGTHLAKAGVAPRTAMAAMRHSSIELTMNVYTDPALLDVASAVEALPALNSPVMDIFRLNNKNAS
ncbi:site-specific tyrosine recombinase XerC [Poriferisphaera corsica]|uniref:Site-specific tyrosine recombinase XerC n=1 Tax=Poriferisphaera corsica TaxID=2528020 RepID=A0A517YS28_9BACT|nr:tyrosine-type recombinase/integrase [Poriferisphaera corsica]QDU33025.1 site-specific tyrosine recombinase XerC [Poriferisphaera corsica]